MPVRARYLVPAAIIAAGAVAFAVTFSQTGDSEPAAPTAADVTSDAPGDTLEDIATDGSGLRIIEAAAGEYADRYQSILDFDLDAGTVTLELGGNVAALAPDQVIATHISDTGRIAVRVTRNEGALTGTLTADDVRALDRDGDRRVDDGMFRIDLTAGGQAYIATGGILGNTVNPDFLDATP